MAREEGYPSRIGPARAAGYRRPDPWRDLALAGYVARNSAERGDEAAYVCPPGYLTWSQYEECSNRLAAVLAELDLGGERVAVHLPDAVAVHVALLACEKAGAVPVGIGVRVDKRDLSHLLGRSGATALVTHCQHREDSAAELFDRLRERNPALRHHLVVPHFELDAAAAIKADGHVLTPAGAPGGPRAFHRAALDVGELDRGDVILAAVPVCHGFGEWTSHIVPAYLGVPAVVMESFDPARALELAESERATVLCTVCAQLRMLLAEASLAERDLSSLRLTIAASGQVAKDELRDVVAGEGYAASAKQVLGAQVG